MIVRAYFDNPGMSFDYFNDAKDTIIWLRRGAIVDPANRDKYVQLADRLEICFHEWCDRSLKHTAG